MLQSCKMKKKIISWYIDFSQDKYVLLYLDWVHIEKDIGNWQG